MKTMTIAGTIETTRRGLRVLLRLSAALLAALELLAACHPL